MLKKSFIEILFRGFSIQRWNDKLRPWDFVQMDKHAHKMIIAWALAKYEEMQGAEFNSLDIVKGGVYELLRRIVISDMPSPVYKEIEKNSELMAKIDNMVFKEVRPSLGSETVREEFANYLHNPDFIDPHSRKILDAAHKYASYWEFQIIRKVNPDGYQIEDITMQLGKDVESYNDLLGIRYLKKNHKIKNFVDLCGQMRYQYRWGHLPRIPKTSVLGHVMLVAALAYFLTIEIEGSCERRIANNFWGGIFHDLPEAVTRDIIRPLKEFVPGMPEEVKRIEKKMVAEEIRPHLEPEWIDELEYYTEDEFKSKIRLEEGVRMVTSDEINDNFDSNEFDPYDGELIKAADSFSAFLEAWSSQVYGVKSAELREAMTKIKDGYSNKSVAGIALNELYVDFGQA